MIHWVEQSCKHRTKANKLIQKIFIHSFVCTSSNSQKLLFATPEKRSIKLFHVGTDISAWVAGSIIHLKNTRKTRCFRVWLMPTIWDSSQPKILCICSLAPAFFIQPPYFCPLCTKNMWNRTLPLPSPPPHHQTLVEAPWGNFFQRDKEEHLFLFHVKKLGWQVASNKGQHQLFQFFCSYIILRYTCLMWPRLRDRARRKLIL